MKNIINYFNEIIITNLNNQVENLIKHPDQLPEFIFAVRDNVLKLGVEMVKETLESMDKEIQDSFVRKQSWIVEAHRSKELVTSLGTVKFNKTQYQNKATGEYKYLLDEMLGLEANQRMTDDALALMLQEAVQTSYRRGGEMASILSEVSKQTVKNKLHSLNIPEVEKKVENKKVVDYLYIDADEYHVSLQFRETKGDLLTGDNNVKNNCLITKLAYVYEGVENESPKSKRHSLINPYFFASVSAKETNKDFWERVYKYIDNNYDVDKIKKIYVNSDGGLWIKEGIKHMHKFTHVLDEFHLEKYLTKLTSHMKDSVYDAKKELRDAIRSHTKADFKDVIERLRDCLETETGNERIDNASNYILSNWNAAKLRMKHKDGVVGSSTEGHVSHILSDRMSSRPMGWSLLGADVMASLRVYEKNGGDMLELVRYQKGELPMAAGAECTIISSSKIRNIYNHGELGKYSDAISHSLCSSNNNIIHINHYLSNL